MLLDICTAMHRDDAVMSEVSWITLGTELETARRRVDACPGRAMPRSIDCAATRSLIVEPGSNVSVRARLRNCSPVRRARSFGSKVRDSCERSRISPLRARRA